MALILSEGNVQKHTGIAPFKIRQCSGVVPLGKSKTIEFGGLFDDFVVTLKANNVLLMNRFDFDEKILHFSIPDMTDDVLLIARIFSSQTYCLRTAGFKKVVYKATNTNPFKENMVSKLGFIPDINDPTKMVFDLAADSDTSMTLAATLRAAWNK